MSRIESISQLVAALDTITSGGDVDACIFAPADERAAIDDLCRARGWTQETKVYDWGCVDRWRSAAGREVLRVHHYDLRADLALPEVQAANAATVALIAALPSPPPPDDWEVRVLAQCGEVG